MLVDMDTYEFFKIPTSFFTMVGGILQFVLRRCRHIIDVVRAKVVASQTKKGHSTVASPLRRSDVGPTIFISGNFRQEFPDYVNIYQKSESQFTVRMGEIPHLTQENRQAIEEKCALMQQFYMELQQEMETNPRHIDPSCTLSQIEKKQMLFEAEVTAILNKPPPAPKKEEEEKKDNAGDGKAKSAADDADMNDEGAA